MELIASAAFKFKRLREMNASENNIKFIDWHQFFHFPTNLNTIKRFPERIDFRPGNALDCSDCRNYWLWAYSDEHYDSIDYPEKQIGGHFMDEKYIETRL